MSIYETNCAGQLRDFETMIRSQQAHATLIECVRLLNAYGQHGAAEKLLLNADRIADKGRQAA